MYNHYKALSRQFSWYNVQAINRSRGLTGMEYTALYRQFRPRVFEEIMGQDHITTTLKNQIVGGRIAHAYLFTGTRGTGKTSTARIFARAVNCADNTAGNPCNRCAICCRDLEGRAIDTIEIDAASNRGVDEIRDLRDKVKYPPADGKYRVYIIDEVHMLTAEAFNALLKTLEEPPSHVIFILATTEPHRLPATIVSRCQRFDFRRISVADMVKRLEFVIEQTGLEVDDDAIRLIAETADGAMRDALSLLDQGVAFNDGRLTSEKILEVLGMSGRRLLSDLGRAIARGDQEVCIRLIDRAIRDGKDIGQLFKDIILFLRDIMIAKAVPSGLAPTARDEADQIRELAGAFVMENIVTAINILSEAETKAKWSQYPRVFLEAALVKICCPPVDASIDSLEERLARIEQIVFSGNGKKSKMTVVAEEDNDTQKRLGASRPEGSNRHILQPDNKDSGVVGKKGSEPCGSIKTDKKSCEQPGSTGADIKLIQRRWAGVLGYIEKNKKGLYTLVQKSEPIALKGNVLTVGCPSLNGIYYDIANSKENIEAFETAVRNVLGQSLDIRVESIDKAQGRAAQKTDKRRGFDLVEEAKRVFGEGLVEVFEEDDNQ
jgi:DNA polymerase-3 subunit gamma/tau